MSERVKGRSILVTGAGSGMGRVIALSLAEEGADVTLFDLNLDAANAVKEEINPSGGSAVVFLGTS